MMTTRRAMQQVPISVASWRSLLLVAMICLVGCLAKYVRKTTDERIELTPERLQRGKYLVDGPGACGACHTTWKNGEFLAGESDDYLAGGNYIEVKSQGYAAWVPNITPEKTTGIAEWSKNEFASFLASGEKPDFDNVQGSMQEAIQHGLKFLTEADRNAIAAYVLGQPPVVNAASKRR